MKKFSLKTEGINLMMYGIIALLGALILLSLWYNKKAQQDVYDISSIEVIDLRLPTIDLTKYTYLQNRNN